MEPVKQETAKIHAVVGQNTQRTFDVHDRSRVRHRKIGPYDWFQEIPRFQPWNIFAAWERLRMIPDSTAPVFRFACDLTKMPGVLPPLITYILLTGVNSIIPAFSLWYSTRMLVLIQEVIESRTLDSAVLKTNILGGVVCALVGQVARIGTAKTELPLQNCAERYVAKLKLQAQLNLDLASSEDPGIRAQMAVFQNTSAWRGLSSLASLVFLIVQSLSQCFVFALVLYQEPSMIIYAVVNLIPVLSNIESPGFDLWSTTWAATTDSPDFISMASVNSTLREDEHRKEIEVGNLQDYLLNKWTKGSDGINDVERNFFDFYFHWHGSDQGIARVLLSPQKELADITLLFQTVRSPSSLPASYASLTLIRSTIDRIIGDFKYARFQAADFSQVLHDFRQLYEIQNIPKVVVDGYIPFPENMQELMYGLSVEFRNVSFKYPRSDSVRYVLKNVSFKVEKGQLCVIVGTNGSGKSTLMKLLLRLYDPTEGIILINGQDIRTLKIKELRSCVATLFQDFTIFPFSIRENIALGNVVYIDDIDLIEEAAKLGGCTEIIDRLPRKMDSFLTMPATNWFSRIPSGTTRLFGSKDLHRFARFPGRDSVEENKLSGGEEQRLALARCFMRTISEEARIALLLFDEPSAALDPEAEYDLFERLRKLRGTKTMIFSSHRFGKLTRHADLILYMKDAEILEQGSHSELIKLGGGYASMYKIQAAAFQD